MTTDPVWLDACLSAVASARVAVFGDFCLDAYWMLDTGEAENSIETGLPVRRVRQQRYSLGGAGNVVANLVDLGCASVEAVGVVGDDLFAAQMLKLLTARKVKTSGMIVSAGWETLVYSKPILGDDELNRIDFGAFNAMTRELVRQLGAKLDEAAARSDVIVLNQQLPGGVSTAAMIEEINNVIARHPRCAFIVDARHRAHLYRGAMLKMNAHEAAHLLGEAVPLEQKISAVAARRLAQSLQQRTKRTVFITRGEGGILVCDGGEVHELPGVLVVGPVDPVGAGDTVVAALAAALGGGSDVAHAARLANIAASITVRKLKTTGTATPQEIRTVGPAPEHVYHVDLADRPDEAVFAPGAAIEIVREPRGAAVRYAVFDHDGTLTTLRQGWEQLMEPVMVRAVIGAADVPPEMRERVTRRVRQLIDHTTGIQTLVQMQHLAELVREMALVPAEHQRDEHHYKALYKAELTRMVEGRMDQLKRGERALHTVLVPGVMEFLAALKRGGVKLYLCSGSDREDVLEDVDALGLSDYFEGRVYGAVGDVKVEAKRMILDQIFAEIGAEGGAVATFGDGPVEMRETRKRGGIAVGLATDETQLGRLSLEKRRRLIRAGADLVIADYTPLQALLKMLNIK